MRYCLINEFVFLHFRQTVIKKAKTQWTCEDASSHQVFGD